MKPIDQLSPVLQDIIGFAKPKVTAEYDINGDRARTEYLTEKFSR